MDSFTQVKMLLSNKNGDVFHIRNVCKTSIWDHLINRQVHNFGLDLNLI